MAHWAHKHREECADICGENQSDIKRRLCNAEDSGANILVNREKGKSKNCACRREETKKSIFLDDRFIFMADNKH